MDVFLISCVGSASFDVPGFWFIMPASMISMWVGLNLVIGSMKLSGTVSASIKKTDPETLLCRFLTISTPTKSSLRNGFPTPATTTLSAPENHSFREDSMSTVCSVESAMALNLSRTGKRVAALKICSCCASFLKKDCFQQCTSIRILI